MNPECCMMMSVELEGIEPSGLQVGSRRPAPASPVKEPRPSANAGWSRVGWPSAHAVRSSVYGGGIVVIPSTRCGGFAGQSLAPRFTNQEPFPGFRSIPSLARASGKFTTYRVRADHCFVCSRPVVGDFGRRQARVCRQHAAKKLWNNALWCPLPILGLARRVILVRSRVRLLFCVGFPKEARLSILALLCRCGHGSADHSQYFPAFIFASAFVCFGLRACGCLSEKCGYFAYVVFHRIGPRAGYQRDMPDLLDKHKGALLWVQRRT
jgi:hypothetical protein